MSAERYGLIEAGGTKFVLGIATADGTLLARHRIPTTTPEETLSAMAAWFADKGALTAIGVATFGPVELDRSSPNWGHILKTPKPGWSDADLLAPLAAHFDCPMALDTDVNAAALAEAQWGAGKGESSVLYFTVGTGIGGGAVINDKSLCGKGHPEMGHIRLARHPDDRDFSGMCPFHGDCLEGLASGPAIMARWGQSLSDLPEDHIAHDIIAYYLAQTVVTMQAVFEPGKIIFGGGVMATPGLIARVQQQARQLGGGYFRTDPDEMVASPALGDDAGLLGALAIALSSTSEQ